jgi:hypothetical protein
MCVSEAISILEQLGTEEPTRNVEPVEVSAALDVLHGEFAGSGQAAVLSMIGARVTNAKSGESNCSIRWTICHLRNRHRVGN